MIIDEPPTETNGSGMPVIGAMPIVMPTLTKTWNRNTNAMPAGDDRAVEVARAGDDLQASPDDEQVEQQQDRGAEEAALLGERREREVGRVLGQVVEARLRRARDAAAAQAAGADRGDRLVHVVGRAARVGVGMREAGQALGLVRLEHVDARPPAATRARRATTSSAISADHRQVQPAHAGDEEHGGEHGGVDERRADVGLDEDEQRSGPAASAIAPQRRRAARRSRLRAVGEERRRATSANSTLPNSDGWKRKKPRSIQRREPRVAAPATSTKHHHAERAEVDRRG